MAILRLRTKGGFLGDIVCADTKMALVAMRAIIDEAIICEIIAISK